MMSWRDQYRLIVQAGVMVRNGYNRMEEKEKQLRAEVERLLAQAEETDAAEDALYGKGNRGDDLTGEMAQREGSWPCVYSYRPDALCRRWLHSPASPAPLYRKAAAPA